jgi:predicted DNA binding CopG/RHH family protein
MTAFQVNENSVKIKEFFTNQNSIDIRLDSSDLRRLRKVANQLETYSKLNTSMRKVRSEVKPFNCN